MKKGKLNKYVLGDSSGSGTILALAIVATMVAALVTALYASNYLVHRSRVQAAADSIALAATDSLRGLATGFPCEIAHSLSKVNVVVLDECRIVGFEVFIRVHSIDLTAELIGRSRAGPSS